MSFIDTFPRQGCGGSGHGSCVAEAPPSHLSVVSPVGRVPHFFGLRGFPFKDFSEITSPLQLRNLPLLFFLMTFIFPERMAFTMASINSFLVSLLPFEINFNPSLLLCKSISEDILSGTTPSSKASFLYIK
jgi:hypothetical protein